MHHLFIHDIRELGLAQWIGFPLIDRVIVHGEADTTPPAHVLPTFIVLPQAGTGLGGAYQGSRVRGANFSSLRLVPAPEPRWPGTHRTEAVVRAELGWGERGRDGWAACVSERRRRAPRPRRG